MSFLSLIGIATAYADTAATAATTAGGAAAPQQSGFLSMLPMLVIFIVVFYFLLIRPQTKRAKDQRRLLSEIQVGDEITTSSGIIGTLSKMDDQFIELTVSSGTVIRMQKAAITGILPKGTATAK